MPTIKTAILAGLTASFFIGVIAGALTCDFLLMAACAGLMTFSFWMALGHPNGGS